MSTAIDTFTPINQPEYHSHFWNYLMGKEGHKAFLDLGRNITGAYALPTASSKKFGDKLKTESLFRQLATVHYAPGGPSTILAKVNTDSAEWVGPGGTISAYNAINNFSTYKLSDHKLAVIMQLDASFLHDNPYIFESYVTDRLVKDFSHAEEHGFINGSGVNMPTGILAKAGGAEIGVTTDVITYENVVKLFFSAKPEYRKDGVWMMNSKTALAIRSLTDTAGQPLWNHTNDTILGKKVYISEYMPDAISGSKPIAFGDLSFYWIVERAGMTVRTLHERFFETGQVGYLAFELLDGKLIRPEAVKVMQMTA